MTHDFKRSAVALALLAALAACGGGDAGDTNTGTDTGGGTTVTAPAITSQPASVTVTAGAAATLAVTASGSSLSYQWYKGTAAISGATSASFTIAATAVADSGSYTVVVSNSGGSVTSSAATLTVNAAGSGSTLDAWTLSNGANPADLAADATTFQKVTIALDTMTVTSSSSALAVGSASDGSTTLSSNGSVVATITQDSFGVTIDANLPSGTLAEYVLSGRYTKTVTLLSSNAFKLTLDGVTIASTNGPAINIQSKQRAFVELVAGTTSTLTDTSTYGARTLADGTAMDLKATLFSEGPVIVSGSGSLSVTAASKHAFASDAHVRIRSGAVALNATKKDGLRANNAVVVDGGTLTIRTPAGKAIKVEGKEDATTPLGFIAINAGTIDITSYDKAITASWESDEDGETTTLADDPDPRVTINGGSINITTTGTPYEDTNLSDGDSSLSPEGIEAKSVLTVNGGTIVVNSTDDALNAGKGIVINGGRIYAKASANDAIDSNGYMTITGGIVVANGAGGAEGGLDCDNNTFTITGGTILGFGGRNSTPTRSVTTQNTVLLTNLAAQLVTLRDATGKAVFSFTLPKASAAALISAPGIATGTAYSLVGGGTLAGYGEDFNGLYLNPTTHSGGSVIKSFTLSSTVTQP